MTKYTLEHYIGNHTKKEGDCLVYTLKTNSWGYARVSQYSPVRKIYGEQLLHRAVWTAQFGIIPKGLIIMHLCDNPACLNIEHLKLGTVFGVSPAAINSIWREATWRHVI